jgi:hypothetical protein
MIIIRKGRGCGSWGLCDEQGYADDMVHYFFIKPLLYHLFNIQCREE